MASCRPTGRLHLCVSGSPWPTVTLFVPLLVSLFGYWRCMHGMSWVLQVPGLLARPLRGPCVSPVLTSVSPDEKAGPGRVALATGCLLPLILDPESAYDDDLGGGFAPSEVIVKCRFRIQDQVAVAVDFMQNIRTFGQKFLYLTFLKVLMPHHGL